MYAAVYDIKIELNARWLIDEIHKGWVSNDVIIMLLYRFDSVCVCVEFSAIFETMPIGIHTTIVVHVQFLPQ